MIKARNFKEHFVILRRPKKDIFAMIRNLGPATISCSFLRILGKLVDDKEYSDNELGKMNWEEKCRLIQSDPVTLHGILSINSISF